VSPLPATRCALVVRTDFSDDAAWRSVVDAMLAPTEEDFQASLDLLDDPAYRDQTTAQLVGQVPEDYEHSFLIVVDALTINAPRHPVVVVDLYEDPGRVFRAVPRAVQAIENNLSIANMDFADFADSVDDSGIFEDF
jgi:hypothetical protein